MTSFKAGQTLGQGDLSIFLTDSGGSASNAYEVTYAIYYVDPGPPEVEVLLGSPTRAPINPTIGEYYASIQVPPSAVPGNYRIRWTFRQYAGDAPMEVVQLWTVEDPTTIAAAPYSQNIANFIRSLRIQLRDLRPDLHYHFAPPESERNIGSYNRVFGQVWEDYELYEYLQWGLDLWNAAPPMTEGMNNLDKLLIEKPVWRTAVMWAAVSHACFALATNWTHEEFSLTGDTYVKVFYESRELDIRMDHLYYAIHAPHTRDPSMRSLSMDDEVRLRKAWVNGNVHVDAVDTVTNRVGRHRVTAVYQHRTPFKRMVSVALVDGRHVSATEDHSLFLYLGGAVIPVQAGDLSPGKFLATVTAGCLVEATEIVSVVYLPPEEYTYDLSVPGPQNFTLSNGILAHNSYSIGGISLDTERSSKYESLGQNAREQFDKSLENKARTVKLIRSVQQPKYGMGIRSAFGPAVGRGVLSARSFM